MFTLKCRDWTASKGHTFSEGAKKCRRIFYAAFRFEGLPLKQVTMRSSIEMRKLFPEESRASNAQSRSRGASDRSRSRRFGHASPTCSPEKRQEIMQHDTCDACHRNFTEYSLRKHFDHNHKTGAARGCLCHECNVALGCLKDDPSRCQDLIAYLLWSST